MKKAVLFDLDGTLLPMDNDAFTKYYLTLLGAKFQTLGYDGKACVKAVWKGLTYMVSNQGEHTNEEAFWTGFLSDVTLLHSQQELNDLLIGFYKKEFAKAKQATQPTSISREIVEKARKNADFVILATNPIFPSSAVEQRLSWIHLTKEDFDYVTTYENSHFCKPNPKYYEEILANMNLLPEDCIMIGNDIQEDMIPASQIGIDSFLVIDHQIGESTDLAIQKGKLQDVAALFSQ